jgi:hypothetical protein
MTALEEAISRFENQRVFCRKVSEHAGHYLSTSNVRYWLKTAEYGLPPVGWWVAISKASKMPLKRFLDDLK